MAIIRFSEFRAQVDKIDQLRAFLRPIVPGILSSEGCRSCQLLHSRDEPTRFLMVEAWESIEAHQASVRTISPAEYTSVLELLDGAPRGEYFENLS